MSLFFSQVLLLRPASLLPTFFPVNDQELEAECVNLVRNKVCAALISEDSDSLCYESCVLLRSPNFSQAKIKVSQYDYNQILADLQLTHQQFVEFCLLCGSDYTSPTPDIGPVKAHKLITKYGSIEKILAANINLSNTLEEFEAAKQQFSNPHVLTAEELNKTSFKFGELDKEGLINFLVHENC